MNNKPYETPELGEAAKVLKKITEVMNPMALAKMSEKDRGMFISAMASTCIFLMVQEATEETVRAFLQQAISDIPRMQQEGEAIRMKNAH